MEESSSQSQAGLLPPERKKNRTRSKQVALGVPPNPAPSRVPSSLQQKNNDEDTHSAPDSEVAFGEESGLMPQRGSNNIKTAATERIQRIAKTAKTRKSTKGVRPDGVQRGGRTSPPLPYDDKDLMRYGSADEMRDPGFPQSVHTMGSPDSGTGDMNADIDKQASYEAGVSAGLEKVAFGMTSQADRQKAHKNYMANRAQNIQRSKMYRMANRAQIARKKKKYNRMVKMKAKRPRKRIGSSGAGYSYMMR